MTRNNPLFIAFSTQKGGAGKSVFTTLAASFLHYQRGYNVLVIDCDEGQYSLHRMRERDMEIVESDPTLERKFGEQIVATNKPAYTILCSPPKQAITLAKNFIEQGEHKIDIVLFDLPGTVNSRGVMQCVAELDYIFTPITSDKIVLESSLAFALAVRDLLINSDSSQLSGLYLYWNMVDARERTMLYDTYEEIINDLGLSLLHTQIPDTKRYKKEMTKGSREVFRSTLFPSSPRMLKGSRFDELIDEILQIIKL